MKNRFVVNFNLQFFKFALLLITFFMVLGASKTSKNEVKYQVQAILLQQHSAEYEVAVLYSVPQPAADSSKVEEKYEIKTSKGKTLEKAFIELEQELENLLSYQSVDCVLLSGFFSKNSLENYALSLKNLPFGSLSANVMLTQSTISEIDEYSKNNVETLKNMLEVFEDAKQGTPRLYQVEDKELVLSMINFVKQNANKVEVLKGKELFYYSTSRYFKLDEQDTKIYKFLKNNKEKLDFFLDDKFFRIEQRLISFEVVNETKLNVKVYALVAMTQKDFNKAKNEIEEYLKKEIRIFMLKSLNIDFEVLEVGAREGGKNFDFENAEFEFEIELFAIK